MDDAGGGEERHHATLRDLHIGGAHALAIGEIVSVDGVLVRIDDLPGKNVFRGT